MKKTAGFTLIELMVVVAIAAILLTTALPSFLNMVQNNLITDQTNELVLALNQTRTEAVKNGRTATVCISSNKTACTGTNWNNGWLVWVDKNNDGTMASSEIVSVLPTPNPTISITATGSITGLAFTPVGSKAISGDSVFTLSTANCSGDAKRAITVSNSGRINVQKQSCP